MVPKMEIPESVDVVAKTGAAETVKVFRADVVPSLVALK